MPKSVSRDQPDTQVVPELALEKRTRRSFSAEDKLRIIKEVAACKRGELGALLRREKIYHSQLSTWRQEFAEHGVTGISKSTEHTRPEGRQDAGAAPNRPVGKGKPPAWPPTRDHQGLSGAPKKSLVDARSREQWERCMNTAIAERRKQLPLAHWA